MMMADWHDSFPIFDLASTGKKNCHELNEKVEAKRTRSLNSMCFEIRTVLHDVQ